MEGKENITKKNYVVQEMGEKKKTRKQAPIERKRKTC